MRIFGGRPPDDARHPGRGGRSSGGRHERSGPVYLSALGASSIDWAVRVWTQTPGYWTVRERLTTQLKEALDAQDLGIPYPQMDVHLDTLAPSNGEHAAASFGTAES